jgi:drug/metabolite transporter (DMT)-like permease
LLRRISANSTDIGLVLVVLVWGFSPTVFKIVLTELQPVTFVFLRFVLLTVFSVAVLAVRGARGGCAWRIARQDVALLIVSGLSGYALYQLLYVTGLAHTTVFASALLGATVPIWTALLALGLRAERFRRVQWLGNLISFAGVAWFLIGGENHQSQLAQDHALTARDLLLGNALTLLAAALFALYGVVNKTLARRYSPPELMCYTLCVGTAALAPFGIPALLAQNWSLVTWRSWLIVPYSVVFPIYLAYTIWNWAIGRRGVGYVTVYSYAVPVMGGLIGFLALGEALTLVQIAAAILILGGMLVARQGALLTRSASSPALSGDRGSREVEPTLRQATDNVPTASADTPTPAPSLRASDSPSTRQRAV